MGRKSVPDSKKWEKLVPDSKNLLSGIRNLYLQIIRMTIIISRRPYYIENAGSHSNSIAKRCKARSVLSWGTARELHGVDGFRYSQSEYPIVNHYRVLKKHAHGLIFGGFRSPLQVNTLPLAPLRGVPSIKRI